MKWKALFVSAVVGAVAGILLEEPIKRMLATAKEKLDEVKGD